MLRRKRKVLVETVLSFVVVIVVVADADVVFVAAEGRDGFCRQTTQSQGGSKHSFLADFGFLEAAPFSWFRSFFVLLGATLALSLPPIALDFCLARFYSLVLCGGKKRRIITSEYVYV